MHFLLHRGLEFKPNRNTVIYNQSEKGSRLSPAESRLESRSHRVVRKRIYYDAGRGVWFYIKTGDWTIGASIPADLKMQLGHYVNISMDTDKPYEFNDEHRKEYPAEKYKKKK
jgi:hypothetical protein